MDAASLHSGEWPECAIATVHAAALREEIASWQRSCSSSAGPVGLQVAVKAICASVARGPVNASADQDLRPAKRGIMLQYCQVDEKLAHFTRAATLGESFARSIRRCWCSELADQMLVFNESSNIQARTI